MLGPINAGVHPPLRSPRSRRLATRASPARGSGAARGVERAQWLIHRVAALFRLSPPLLIASLMHSTAALRSRHLDQDLGRTRENENFTGIVSLAESYVDEEN